MVDKITIHARTSCHCDDECDCPSNDDMYFKVNGQSGYGGGDLVYNENRRDSVYACQFMGFKFEADSKEQAAEKIRGYFKAFKCVEVEVF